MNEAEPGESGADVLSFAVVLRNVSQGTGRGALKGVDAVLAQGERVALVGPAGSGKSGVLALLDGRLRNWTGTAILFAHPMRADRGLPRAVRLGTGFIPHEPALVPRATVFRNVMLGRLGRMPRLRSLLGEVREEDTAVVLSALEEVGLATHAAETVAELSPALHQRVAIARCLAQEPKLILAEDPVEALEPLRAESTLRLLSDIAARRGATLVFSCRQAPLALRYADRVLAMIGGRVALDGRPADLRPPQLDALYGAGGQADGKHLRLVV